jgi:uncharacterized membrane protein YcaP (DUF421 family)
MSSINFFFDGWEPVLRVVVVGSLSYIFLLIFVRISGKRTLSKMSAFDFIVTITLGSAFGRILTARNVALVECLAAFLTLILLQWLVSTLRVHFKKFEHLVDAEPALLYFNGRYNTQNMQKERITESEILAKVREEGLASLDEVEAVILESAGTLAVILKQNNGLKQAVAAIYPGKQA